ncbi:regulatory protein [Dongia mobilis]|uniref:Regulatory protein n=1 Tax=Dongia mobilis TaxID=578943 RepID=A0A4R6WJL6_9PROT|nr:RecX family transcriptional regulator [Dongia mobilis]TDQ78818.1 regulatory protein [Dongia mobilis]
MKSRKPKRLTRNDLDQVALDYLARFAATEKRVRDMLVRRIRRSAAAHDEDPAPLLAAVTEIVQSLVARKLLDDRSFAAMKAASLTRRGASRHQIGVKLAQLGVDGAMRDAAIADLAEEFGDSDHAAAIAYAKRRRLGPYRARHIAGAQRLIQEKRDLAAMARAGFSLALARQVLASDIEIEPED